MKVIKIEKSNEADYENFVAAHKYGSFLQSTDWGNFKQGFGWNAQRVLVENNEPQLSAQILTRQIFSKFEIAYIPHGPVFDPINSQAKEALTALINWIRQKYKSSVLIRLDPKIEINDINMKILEDLKLKKTDVELQPKNTLVIDLTKTEEELLNEMHPKARYNIRLSQKRGVKIGIGSEISDAQQLSALIDTTSDREKIKSHGKDYYEALYHHFVANNKAVIYSAKYNNQTIASILVMFYGDTATYLYGGSDNVYREHMPNHLLQWTAIKDAKIKGYKKYDFWGIAPTGSPDHRWAGITRFKKQFGGDELYYVGPFDLPMGPMYKLFRIAEKVRSKR